MILSIILSIVIVAIGGLIYWVQAREHAEWVKMQKDLAEIEAKEHKAVMDRYNRQLDELNEIKRRLD